MKNLLYLCLTFLLATNFISAQTDSIPSLSKFAIHGEAASAGLVSSLFLNLEGKFYSSASEKIHFYGRAGFGYVDVSTFIICNGQTAYGGSIGFGMITGKGNHHFELFGGGFFGFFKSKNNDSGLFRSCRNFGNQAVPVVDLGYRFQKPGDGLFFRAKFGVYGLGIGLGYAF